MNRLFLGLDRPFPQVVQAGLQSFQQRFLQLYRKDQLFLLHRDLLLLLLHRNFHPLLPQLLHLRQDHQSTFACFLLMDFVRSVILIQLFLHQLLHLRQINPETCFDIGHLTALCFVVLSVLNHRRRLGQSRFWYFIHSCCFTF